MLGTKENAHCSNRGICDTETGICTCAINLVQAMVMDCLGREVIEVRRWVPSMDVQAK